MASKGGQLPMKKGELGGAEKKKSWMIHKPTSTQDQRGTKRPVGKMQKNIPRAAYWMTPRLFTISPTTHQSGCTVCSASAKDEVMPEHPKATRTSETKSPIHSCDLR